MSLHYLANACAAFEKRAGLTFDLDNAKAKAAELITDMSIHEACEILGVTPEVTNDELMFAFKAKLMDLQSSPEYGFSKRLVNLQNSVVMAFAMLEPLAEENSKDSYAFEGDDDFQEKTVMPLEDKIAQFERLAQTKPDFAATLNKFKGAIQAEAARGIASINRLITSNKEAAADPNFQSLDEGFGKLSDLARLLQPETVSVTLVDIKALIVKNLFFTSGQNAGMGYDPLTRLGGATSPAACLDRIYEYVKILEKLSVQNKS